MLIAIEGNIGAGKSTLFNLLKKEYEDNENFEFLEEPINYWRQFKDESNDIFKLFYDNKQRWGFTFQHTIFLSCIELFVKTKHKIVVTERSIRSGYEVFCHELYDNGTMSKIEFDIMHEWNRVFHEIFPFLTPDLIIYVKTSPEISYQHAIDRNRSGEIVSLEFINKISEYYDKWMNQVHTKYTFNGDNHVESKEYLDSLQVVIQKINNLTN